MHGRVREGDALAAERSHFRADVPRAHPPWKSGPVSSMKSWKRAPPAMQGLSRRTSALTRDPVDAAGRERFARVRPSRHDTIVAPEPTASHEAHREFRGQKRASVVYREVPRLPPFPAEESRCRPSCCSAVSLQSLGLRARAPFPPGCWRCWRRRRCWGGQRGRAAHADLGRVLPFARGRGGGAAAHRAGGAA